MPPVINMNKKKFIYLLFLVTAFTRFWKIGEIPAGLSLQEVNFGLYASGFFGDWVLSPFWIRLPFGVLGTISVFLLYYVIFKLTKDFKTSVLTAFIFSISPWHIQESRISSLGILIVVGILLAAIVFRKRIGKNPKLLGIVLIFLSFFIFGLSLLKIPQELRVNVDQDRNIASRVETKLPARLFSNKFIESYRYRAGLVFENLDIGNYFFKGHPRERWGVEETQKLFIGFLPLLVVGLFKIKRETRLFLAGAFLFAAVSLASFGLRAPTYSLPLLLPISFITALGAKRVLAERKNIYKYLGYLVFFVVLWEFMSFLFSYYSGFEEGRFTPRRSVYEDLVNYTKELDSEEIVVSERLDNPEEFFRFYLKDKNMESYEFSSFNIKEKEDEKGVYIDILPDEAGPSEPLYKKDGKWPEEIDVLGEFYEKNKGQTIVVFRN